MTDTRGGEPAEPVSGTEAIDNRIVEKEAGFIRGLVNRSRAPWLTLAVGFVMTLVGLPVAWVTFGSLLSPASSVPFLTQLAAILFGAELDSGGGGWMTKLIILALSLVAAGIGVVTVIASLSVLFRRGAKHAVHGTKQAAAFAKEHDLKGKVEAGASRIADGTRGAATMVRDSDVSERARESLASGSDSIRKGGLRLGDAIKARYEQVRSGEEAVEGDLIEPPSGPPLGLPPPAEDVSEPGTRPPRPPSQPPKSIDPPRIEIKPDDPSR